MNLRTSLTLVSALAILTLGALAPAQQGGGRGMGGMGRGGQMPKWMLVQRKDVKADLKITDEQTTKLEALQEETTAKFAEIRQNAGEDRAAMQKGIADMMKGIDEKIVAILTPEQAKRLDEIAIQMGGMGAAMRPEVATALALTDDQKTKIKALQDGMQKATRALFEKMRSGEMNREGMQETMKKNSAILDTEIAKILTDAQKTKLKTLGGAPFTRDDEAV